MTRHPSGTAKWWRLGPRTAAALVVAALLAGVVPSPATAADTAETTPPPPADGERTELVLGVDDGVDPNAVADEVELAGGRVLAVHDHAVSVEMTEADAEQVPSARSVEPSLRLVPMLSNSTTRVRADIAHAQGVTGSGRRVVVIDTGIDHTLPELDVVAGACFASGNSCTEPQGSVAAGAECPGGGDCDHGTRVAQTVAAVAPNVELVSVRIFGAGGGSASSQNLLEALDWVHNNRGTLRPDVVNISLGEVGSFHAGACDGSYPGLTQAIQRLRNAGIATVIASGNEGRALAISPPACLSPAVAVTATTNSDQIAPYSNRGSLATLAAPGNVTIAGSAEQGTSFAAPHVAGAWALVRGQTPSISVAEAEWRLRDRARRITDPQTGLQVRRLDVAATLGIRSPVTPPPAPGGWVVTNQGRVHNRGAAHRWGGATVAPGERVVAGTPTSSGVGYWLVTDSGRVMAFGDAIWYGDARGLALNQPIIGMATTRTGRGYWLLGTDGGVFSYGDARFHGSTGGMRLNAPVTDIARSPGGHGYWLSALDGGIFSFGDARFHGSTGGMRLNQPAVSMAPSRAGYWLVALDGGIFAFGDARFHGSLPGIPVFETGLRIRANADGGGYHILTREGLLARFGNATNLGPRVPLAPGEAPVDLMLLG